METFSPRVLSSYANGRFSISVAVRSSVQLDNWISSFGHVRSTTFSCPRLDDRLSPFCVTRQTSLEIITSHVLEIRHKAKRMKSDSR